MATRHQSPYLRPVTSATKPAILSMTSFSLWRHWRHAQRYGDLTTFIIWEMTPQLSGSHGIGGGDFWAGWAVTCPFFVRHRQALLLAVPLLCLQINFSSISNWTHLHNHRCMLKPVQNNICSQKVLSASRGFVPQICTGGFALGPQWRHGVQNSILALPL